MNSMQRGAAEANADSDAAAMIAEQRRTREAFERAQPVVHTYNPETHFLQPRISGYRQLTPTEVALINEVKALGEKAASLVDTLNRCRSEDGTQWTDPRWVAIGRTHLQEGFSALTRAIARPTGF